MKTKMMAAAAMLAALTTTFSCNNNQQQQTTKTELNICGKEDCKEQSKTASKLSIDEALANGETLVNHEITMEGICTHTCKHGAKKIFLMGSDDTQTMRVEAGALGAFDTRCINAIVTVKGILREQRIDEAYLQNWETKLKAQTAPQHGEGEQGCATEKKAQGETGNSPAERIADFRKRIAERKAATGKDYLSFYFLEASSYEIAD